MLLLNRVSPVQRRQLGDSLLWMLASTLVMLAVPILLAPLQVSLAANLSAQTTLGIGLIGWLGLRRLPSRRAATPARAWDGGRAAIAGLGAGAAGSAALALCWHLSPSARALLESRAGQLAPLLGAGAPTALLVLAVLPAACEELFYRGLLRRTLHDWSPTLRVVLVSMLFAAAHLDPLSALPLVLAGVVMGVLAEQTDRWTVPAAAHLALNAFGVLVWARRYPDIPPAPETAAAILVAGVLVSWAALGPARAAARP